MGSKTKRGFLKAGIIAVAVSSFGLTGCQVDIGGQTLPSPFYLDDDIHYFPAGPEFKLSREAAAMEAFSEDSNIDAN